jgi:hypothetical protein
MTASLLRHQRILALTSAAICFAILYFAAKLFIGNYSLLGLDDNTIRSIAHFSVYGTLALIVARALWNIAPLAWLITVLFATAEELHQLFVQYRFACIQDWTINIMGITTFLLGAHCYYFFTSKNIAARCTSQTI